MDLIVISDVTLTEGANINPGPVSSFPFIVVINEEAFSASVMPDGSGQLHLGESVTVTLKFFAPEAASKRVKEGVGFTFNEGGRKGIGLVLEIRRG
jgi:hypothetical protein